MFKAHYSTHISQAGITCNHCTYWLVTHIKLIGITLISIRINNKKDCIDISTSRNTINKQWEMKQESSYNFYYKKLLTT